MSDTNEEKSGQQGVPGTKGPVPSRTALAWSTSVLAVLLIITAGLAMSWRGDAQKYRDLPPIVKQMAGSDGFPSGPGGIMPPGGQGGMFPGGQNGMPPGGFPSGMPPITSPSPGG
jgi:hypothetical protein